MWQRVERDRRGQGGPGDRVISVIHVHPCVERSLAVLARHAVFISVLGTPVTPQLAKDQGWWMGSQITRHVCGA